MTSAAALPHTLECTVLISATRATVFGFFTDPERWAAWWGAGSSIEPRPGGAMRIVYPDGTAATGQVLEIEDGRRVVFTYGYESGKMIPPGGSRVTITLEEGRTGTLVRLRHELADQGTRDAHVQGWRYQLALFANVTTREQHRDAASVIDRYFALWNLGDDVGRRQAMEGVVTPDVIFQDAHGCTAGVDDLAAHIVASRRFMPGLTLERDGEVRHCQGTALADWRVTGADGAVIARGTNVVQLAPDGRINRAVGFWGELKR